MALVFPDQDLEMTPYLTPASTYPRMTRSLPRLDLPTVIKKKILRPVIQAIPLPKLLNKDRTGMIIVSKKTHLHQIIFHLRLQEILESEKMYVTDLEQVVQYLTYMRESKEAEEADIPMPEDLRQGRDRMIFGNIESIYEWHRE